MVPKSTRPKDKVGNKENVPATPKNTTTFIPEASSTAATSRRARSKEVGLHLDGTLAQLPLEEKGKEMDSQQVIKDWNETDELQGDLEARNRRVQETPNEELETHIDNLAQKVESSEAKQFKVYQRSVNRIATYVRSDRVNELTLEAMKLRLEHLKEQFGKGNDLYALLVCQLDDAGLINSYEEAMEIMEEEYWETAEVLRTKVSLLESSQGNLENRTAGEAGVSSTDRSIKVILPTQQHNMQNTWGQFDGNFKKWLGFRERFQAAIMDNVDISDSYKLMYLKGSLLGKAAATLGDDRLSNDNAQEAWDRLYEVFNKPYLIAREYMNDFYSLPSLHGQATADELQHMANVTH